MTTGKVGYCNPPEHTRFQKGISGNPKGRGRREIHPATQIVDEILNAQMTYRERGKLKTAARAELSIKRLITSALNGNVQDADELLKLWKNANDIDPGPVVIKIVGGLPPDQGR